MSPPQSFARLTALNILANITVPLASLADTAMLGRLTDIRFLAGVALASVLFDYVYWTFGFLRMGTTGLTAVASGRGDEQEVGAVLYRALATALSIGLAILLLQGPIGLLGFRLLSGDAGVESAGLEYFSIRIWAAPATLANFAVTGWLLGRGRSGLVLAVTTLGTVSNVAFNYWFIVLLGWNAFGAGLGTLLAQCLMLGANLLLVLPRSTIQSIDWAQAFAPRRLRDLWTLNFDLVIRTFCLLTVFALFTNVSAIMGTDLLAANTLLLRLLTFAAFWIDGAAFATETWAGYLVGSGDRRGLGRLLRGSLVTGIAFAMFFLLALALVPGRILGLLTSHLNVVAGAIQYAFWLAPALLVGSVAYILDGYFLGLTDARALRNSMLLSFAVGFAPLAFWAHSISNNHLLWAALSAFMAARVVALGRKVPSTLALDSPSPLPDGS